MDFRILGTSWELVGADDDVEYVPSESRLGIVLGEAIVESLGIEQVRGLFVDMGTAFHCDYGVASSLEYWNGTSLWHPRDNGVPSPVYGLADVFWLQFFGPGFVTRWPALREAPGAMAVDGGGVVVRTSEYPTGAPHPGEAQFEAEWKRPLVKILGTDAYDIERARHVLPSARELQSHDPLREPEPAVGAAAEWIAEGEAAEERRAAEHVEAHRARLQLQRAAPSGGPGELHHEWSINVDSEDVGELLWRIVSALGGEASGEYEAALRQEVASAGHGVIDQALLGTASGDVLITWKVNSGEVVLGVHADREIDKVLDSLD